MMDFTNAFSGLIFGSLIFCEISSLTNIRMFMALLLDFFFVHQHIFLMFLLQITDDEYSIDEYSSPFFGEHQFNETNEAEDSNKYEHIYDGAHHEE